MKGYAESHNILYTGSFFKMPWLDLLKLIGTTYQHKFY